MPYILGLTGNIASGKTTVGLQLLELGVDVYVDADLVVHELYLPGQPLVAELASVFGPEIVDAAGGIDRAGWAGSSLAIPRSFVTWRAMSIPRSRARSSHTCGRCRMPALRALAFWTR